MAYTNKVVLTPKTGLSSRSVDTSTVYRITLHLSDHLNDAKFFMYAINISFLLNFNTFLLYMCAINIIHIINIKHISLCVWNTHCAEHSFGR